MMRKKIIEKAREYLGTPFVHQGRLKGIGVDCIGLIVGVASELKLFEYDHAVYPRYSDGTLLMAHMRKVFVEISPDERQPGDVVIYWVQPHTKHPQHVGIVTDIGILHTYDIVKRVVETHTHQRWEDRVTHAFQWPGVSDTWQP